MSWEFNKIYQRLWDDENFCTLPGDHQAVVFYLLTTKEGNRIGLYRLSVAMASEKLKVSQKVFRKRLKAVCAALHWEWDPETGVIFIPTWFKYYPIAEGATKNLIGYMSDLRQLPRTDCKNNLIGRFFLNQAFIPPSMKELFLQQFQLHIGIPHSIPHRGGITSEIEIETESESEREKRENSHTSFSSADKKDSAKQIDTTHALNGHASQDSDRGWADRFQKFMTAYPRKEQQDKVEQWFKVNHPSAEVVDQMVTTIAAFKLTDRWREKDGQFIPFPLKWLNEKRWEDEAKIDLPPKRRMPTN